MKETFYFPHDYNSSEDEKILKLLSVLGWEGYGLYWGIIEKLASSSEAKLKLSDLEYIAFGMRTQCERITNVVRDYNLFIIEGDYFWSNRLVAFFKEKEKKSAKAKESAKVRWASEANKNANASKNDAIKERKGKEKKGKERENTSFKKRGELLAFGEEGEIKLSKEEHLKLCTSIGRRNANKYIQAIENWKLAKGKSYKNDYRGILGWIKNDKEAGKLRINWEDFMEEDFESKTDYEKIINKYQT